ncbi:hypothetical protein YYG_00666 [Plasmodium vinckei petteri]|uniref:Transcription initiation factor IIA subunit 2 n=2 Tax=Plasmodium vinckei TaxID=5860 RepID=W7ASA8_PLAVN|nr:hypothetical protein YYG_00666 [Plasmodium vinckei petteri]CAD2106132.1 conserved Plasmodium protein, unknown function [Plasmodium vinckei lentum]CAD2114491.1 conserved Plasmodium protein, unknown function [Plasmodium vinckei petteri]
MEENNDDKFSNFILLESLKEALNQMIDEFYVEKDVGIKIYKEACMNMKKEIDENSNQLADVNITGQLKSYYCRNDVWTFYFKNSLFKISKNKKAKSSTKDYKNYLPLNLKTYKTFYNKKDIFLESCIDNNNIKFLTNFGKCYSKIVNKEYSENENDDIFFYYDGLIKILCIENSPT